MDGTRKLGSEPIYVSRVVAVAARLRPVNVPKNQIVEAGDEKLDEGFYEMIICARGDRTRECCLSRLPYMFRTMECWPSLVVRFSNDARLGLVTVSGGMASFGAPAALRLHIVPESSFRIQPFA